MDMRAFIECRLRGGLGNQLFIVATGISQALRLSCELRVLPHKMFSGDTKRKIEIGFLDGVPGLRFAKRRLSFLRYTEDSFAYSPAIQSIVTGTLLDGYFQSWKYVGPALEVIRSKLVAASGLPPASDFISVHVRRGDYLNPRQQKFHGLLSGEYFVRSVRRLRSELGPLPVRIFSDSPADSVVLSRRIADAEVDSTPGDAASVLGAMSAGKAFVLSNSSFSWWAATLAKDRKPVVIAPKHWFKDPNIDASDLCPSSWHRQVDPAEP